MDASIEGGRGMAGGPPAEPVSLGFANRGRGRFVLTSVQSTEDPTETPGITTITMRSAPPHQGAHIGLLFAALQDRGVEFPGDLAGRPATSVVLADTLMGGLAIDVRQGRVAHADGGGLMMLPTGARTKGFRIANGQRMAILEGHIGAELNTDPGLLAVPRPAPLALAAIASLPDTEEWSGEHELPDAIGLTVSGTYRMLGQTVPSVTWSFTDRQGPADDPDTILNGFLTVPPDSGLVSEHGSVHLGELRHQMVGVVPTPPGQRFADLLAAQEPLLDVDAAAALPPDGLTR